MSDQRDVLERAVDFACLKLPGQPMAMHMGTSYLVHDLAAEVRTLRTQKTDLLALAHQYASECAECGGTGFASHTGTQRCEQCSDIWQVIDKAEGRV